MLEMRTFAPNHFGKYYNTDEAYKVKRLNVELIIVYLYFFFLS